MTKYLDNREQFKASGFSTKAIHVGLVPDSDTGAMSQPIYQTSTYLQDDICQGRNGYEYARQLNPNRDALQYALAALEGGSYAYVFASGLAACDTILRTVLAPNDLVVLGSDIYGGTYRLINSLLAKWGLKNQSLDLSDTQKAIDAIDSLRPKLLWLETPTNPMMHLTDIKALSRAARRIGTLVVADNTFATPYITNPISLGADFAVHSTTKYISGHSDSIGGAIISATDAYKDALWLAQYGYGAILSPFDCYLTSRGLKTLSCRMERHSANALELAQFLLNHKKVKEVYYPHLSNHSQYLLAKEQMRLGGGMLTIKMQSPSDAKTLCRSTRLFALAESLGGVESLINYPSDMTHASLKGTPLALDESIVRLSVGIENIEDIIEDISYALDKL